MTLWLPTISPRHGPSCITIAAERRTGAIARTHTQPRPRRKSAPVVSIRNSWGPPGRGRPRVRPMTRAAAARSAPRMLIKEAATDVEISVVARWQRRTASSLRERDHSVRNIAKLTYTRGDGTQVEATLSFAEMAGRFGGRRMWFLCPCCQRPCRVLYGSWRIACRRCHGLRYRSQSEGQSAGPTAACSRSSDGLIQSHRQQVAAQAQGYALENLSAPRRSIPRVSQQMGSGRSAQAPHCDLRASALDARAALSEDHAGRATCPTVHGLQLPNAPRRGVSQPRGCPADQ